MSENSTSKLEEILQSGVAPGFPQKGRLDPQGCQAKALKGLREIENTPRYKNGPNQSAGDISRYMGLGSATTIKKVWERPFRKKAKRELVTV